MDSNFELQRLIRTLVEMGYDRVDAADIARNAAVQISDQIADAVADALHRAEQAGVEMGAMDFAAELNAHQLGSSFAIDTDSGRTDFSEPPFPMLPHLLKAGKVAKDGSIYKRIPIPKNRPSKGMGTSSTQAVEQRASELEIAKQKVNDEVLSQSIMPDPMTAAKSYADAYRSARQPKKDRTRTQATGPVDIVTASSKQNPATQWVLPAKDFDMTATLADINANLQQTIEEIIRSTIARYTAG